MTIKKTDNRFRSAANQAAYVLGVNVADRQWMPNACYDANRAMLEVHSTECGKTLIVSYDDNFLDAALVSDEACQGFDFDPYEERNTMRSLARIANISSPFDLRENYNRQMER